MSSSSKENVTPHPLLRTRTPDHKESSSLEPGRGDPRFGVSKEEEKTEGTTKYTRGATGTPEVVVHSRRESKVGTSKRNKEVRDGKPRISPFT